MRQINTFYIWSMNEAGVLPTPWPSQVGLPYFWYSRDHITFTSWTYTVRSQSEILCFIQKKKKKAKWIMLSIYTSKKKNIHDKHHSCNILSSLLKIKKPKKFLWIWTYTIPKPDQILVTDWPSMHTSELNFTFWLYCMPQCLNWTSKWWILMYMI